MAISAFMGGGRDGEGAGNLEGGGGKGKKL